MKQGAFEGSQEMGWEEPFGQASDQEAWGEQSPKFAMKVVKHYRTALDRQVPVRIRRGSHLELNQCYIPRPRVEEEEPDGPSEKRKKD